MAFEYVVVKEELDIKEETNTEVPAALEKNEPERKQIALNNSRSAKNEVLRRRRVSYEQLECLWEFLNSHRDVAIGYNKSTQARDISKRMWVSVSETLNSLEDGATKDWKVWSNYWVDYKAKLKKRVASLRVSENCTGGGSAEVIPLSDIEKKFLSLLGEGFGSGSPKTQADPYPIITPLKHIVPKVEQQQPQDEQELSSYDDPLEEHLDIKEEPLLSLQQEEAPTIQEEEPFVQEQRPVEPQGPTNVRRRRRTKKPTANMTQEMAREALVEISRARLLVEQENSKSLSLIAEGMQKNQLLLQDMAGTLNRIASVIDRSVGSGRPETEGEGVPES